MAKSCITGTVDLGRTSKSSRFNRGFQNGPWFFCYTINRFQIDTTGRTRGHSLKLVKCRCNKDIRKYFFSHRVVSKWNMLNNDSVMAKTVNGFKTKLERERAKKTGLFLD